MDDPRIHTDISGFTLRFAAPDDLPVILELIRSLAEYERLSHACVATEERLDETLFGEFRRAEVVLGEYEQTPVGFALFFHNYSTFLARPGIYLEDLFVKPAWRGRGFGRALLTYVAELAVERGCGRLEWSVLDWNVDAIRFYERLGAVPMEEWTTMRVSGAELEALGSGDKNG